MPGNCPAQFSPCSSPVENIPFQGERHSGGPQKVFAFPPEWVFAFRTECLFGITTEWCSSSDRNRFRLQPESAPCPFASLSEEWPRLPEKQNCCRAPNLKGGDERMQIGII